MEPTGRLTRPDVSDDGTPPDADAAPPIRAIGRFTVTHKLGEGGMGVVYAAHDAELDRDVAIKLLRSDSGDSSSGRARLLREARAMAKLSHPNVITVYDVGMFDQHVFIAMELVHGTSLRSWLKQRPRTWRGALECFVEAGRGLAAAHTAGLIHRDFKPDNVLVGDDGRVRVLDFGLARATDGEPDEVTPDGESFSPADAVERLTLTGAVIGTPGYMAPEQWRGGIVDHRTDQFSFCIALWEALFGQRPFGGSGATAIAARVMAGDIRRPPEDRNVPAWLVRVLRRGLSVDPTQRFRSMDALLGVLSRLRNERGDDESALVIETPAATGPLFARRYELRDGGIARDRLTGRTVAIRRIAALAPGSAAAEARIVRLRTLAVLGHPNVVAVIDHGLGDGEPWVALEHAEGAVDWLEHGRDRPRAIQLALVAQLLRAVDYLHAHDLVHQQLSRRTVVVQGGQVKMADPIPCLADALDDEADSAYVAPEVLLGEHHDPAADLYSIGVLAHELLTGRLPHRASSPGERLDETLSGRHAIATAELDDALAQLLHRMLQPDPRQRFPSAAAALRALVQLSRASLTVETVETRECALRTARFAGRDKEVTALVTAMRRCTAGSGETWLLAGESGAGKSRLLDELRAEAVARGAVTIRGQARADGGRPYEVWRELFRFLALVGDENVASVLAPLVPDIDRLRGQPHKPVPELDAKSTQQRLLRAVASALANVGAPLVLLLDDLQWAGSESIDLLERLAPRLHALPVLVIAGYREEEAAQLPTAIPSAKTLSLQALDKDAIAELARAMTGAHTAALLPLLERETEGNALLLVEVMRFLAEEAGDLHAIASMAIPASVAAGGVRRVMRRRIERVEPWARPLLDHAAIIGRGLDLAVLGRFAETDEDLERFLAHARDCAVLEHEADRWRFRHDKLREELLQELGDARRRELHREVGRAVRAIHGDAHTQALAHHFREAGELAEEARYSGLAGEQALANGAYRDAARLLSRAIELREHGGFARLELMRWQRMLGEACYVLGDLSRAVAGLSGTLAEFGRPLPHSRVGWGWLLLRLVAMQMLLLALPGRFIASQQRRRDELREAANAAGRLANLSTYSGDVLRILACSLLSANLAERAGHPSPYSLAVMGYSASYMAMPKLADRYFGRATSAAIEHDDPIGLVEAGQMECAYRLGSGDLARCRTLLETGYAAAERADYQLGIALSEGFVGECEFLLGNFQTMLAHYSRARELLALPSPEHEHSFICGEAHALCMLGRLDEAERLLDGAAQRGGAQYLLGEAFVLATRCLVYAYRGDAARSHETARATMDYVHKHKIAIPPPCGYVLGGPAEALLVAARNDASTLELATQHAEVLRKWAKQNPVGEAPALLFEGQLLALRGELEQGIEHCERSLTAAKRLGLRFCQAQAELELGRLRGAD
ncbi:MAG TPA: protein kinase, partial [Nannocystaceae bacterium]|nr:protein kinase [Nannocystaceae bacterium]